MEDKINENINTDVDSEENLIMMFFTGRLFELVNTYFKKNPNEILSYQDFLYMKNKAWKESTVVFNIVEERI